NGRLLRDSSFDSMRADILGERRLLVEFARDSGPIQIEGATLLASTERTATLSFDPRRITARALIDRIAAGYDVDDIRVEDASIEEVIARFYALHGATEA